MNGSLILFIMCNSEGLVALERPETDWCRVRLVVRATRLDRLVLAAHCGERARFDRHDCGRILPILFGAHFQD